MDQLKSIIVSVNGETLNSTVSFLTVCIQDAANEEIIIGVVNDLLTNIKTRRIGLEIVAGIIEYCSADVLVENSSNWLKCCMDYKGEEHVLRLDITEKLIRIIGFIESFAKKFISEYLRDILKTCLICDTDVEKRHSLKCLCQCFEKYPNGITSNRDQVERFLLQFLENTSGNYVEDAAVAFHYFIQTGNPGVGGLNYINNFRHHFVKLCNTVLDLYKIYFKRIQEDSQNDNNLEIVTNEIVNNLIFIRTMIRKKFSVEKQINIKKLIVIFKEGFSIQTCSLDGNALFCVRRVSTLKRVQLQLLHILQVFINGNLTSLLPFSHIIMKILLNCLKKSTSYMHFTNNLFYKKQLYRTLSCWLQLSNSANNVDIQETLVSILLSDFIHDKKNTCLTLNISKAYGVQKNFVDRSHLNDTIEVKMYVFFLGILKCILTAYPMKINKMLWQELVTYMIQKIHNEYTDCETFSDDSCVTNLYYILILLLKQGNMECIPSRHLLISLLKKGINNSNNIISRSAYEGLKTIEALSHSVAHSFCYNDQQLYDSDYMRNQKENKSKCLANYFHSFQKPIVRSTFKEGGITKKDINILSDIVITKSGSEKNVNLIEKNRNNQNNSKNKKDIFDDHCKNNERVCQAMTEEPPQKKMKPQSDILHEMIGTFENLVQYE